MTTSKTSPRHQAAQGSAYICPMCPEVRESEPMACPSCGMALEPEFPAAPAKRVQYTCPMHPEIVQDEPGSCPKCGMALEPVTVRVEQANPELEDMTRRFWVSLILTVPIFLLAMSDLIPGQPLLQVIGKSVNGWIQLVLATPVVLWGGWPFFQRGFPTGVEFGSDPQPQYVHADRPRHRNGLWVQPDRQAAAWYFPRIPASSWPPRRSWG